MATSTWNGFLAIDTTEAGLESLGNTLNRVDCRHELKGVSITVMLPEYPKELHSEYETGQDRQFNNEAATWSLLRVFKLLVDNLSHPGAQDAEPFLQLEIDGAYSPSDKRDKPIFSETVEYGVRPDLYENRFRFSLLDLAPTTAVVAADLPQLPFVREFLFNNMSGTRTWSPCVAALLTTKITRAISVNWNFQRPPYTWYIWGGYFILDRMFRDILAETISVLV